MIYTLNLSENLHTISEDELYSQAGNITLTAKRVFLFAHLLQLKYEIPNHNLSRISIRM